MPTSLLDLPREIRDLIYKYALISAVGHVKPWPVFPSDTPSLSPGRHTLDFVVEQEAGRGRCNYRRYAISLSILRTCRQIHQETKTLFWHNNMFEFPSPCNMLYTLDRIGQIPSRLITSAAFSLQVIEDTALSKAFNVLVGLANHGSLKSVILNIPFHRFNALLPVENYKKLLKPLKSGLKDSTRDIERWMKVALRRPWGGSEQAMVRGLHFAWGGKMICNGKLEWEDGRQVGEFTKFIAENPLSPIE